MSSKAKPLKVDPPKLTGRQIQFKDWIEEFQDFASKCGFLKYLGPAGFIPVDRSTDDEELIRRGHSQDDIGFAEDALYSLRSACRGQTLKNLVKNFTNPYEAFENVKQHYLRNPNSEQSLLLERFEKMQYRRGQDPRALYSTTQDINHQMEQVGLAMDEHMFRTKFLNLLPSDYDVALAIIRDDSEIDETEMLERLHERYQVLVVRDKRKGNDSKNPTPYWQALRRRKQVAVRTHRRLHPTRHTTRATGRVSVTEVQLQ